MLKELVLVTKIYFIAISSFSDEQNLSLKLFDVSNGHVLEGKKISLLKLIFVKKYIFVVKNYENLKKNWRMIFCQNLRPLVAKLNFVAECVLLATKYFIAKICQNLKKFVGLFSAKIKFQRRILNFIAKNSCNLFIYHLLHFFILSFILSFSHSLILSFSHFLNFIL